MPTRRSQRGKMAEEAKPSDAAPAAEDSAAAATTAAGSKRRREDNDDTTPPAEKATAGAPAEPAVEPPTPKKEEKKEEDGVEMPEMPPLPSPARGSKEEEQPNGDDGAAEAAAEAEAAAGTTKPSSPTPEEIADVVTEAAKAEADQPKAKRTRLSWNDRFEQLKQYKAEHGHCNINIRYAANRTLGKWVNNQREQYKTYRKIKEREAAEAAAAAAAADGDTKGATGEADPAEAAAAAPAGPTPIEPAGTADAKEAEAEAEADTKEEAEAATPTTPTPKKPSKQHKCPMTEERVRLLESVGFAWTTNREKQFDDGWNRRLEELREYKKEFGDCLVPHGFAPNPALAEWVHRQRCTYVSFMNDEAKGEADKKDSAGREVIRKRMESLRELDFAFRVKEDTWTSRLDDLRAYKARHGDCAVPINYAENPSLGRWVHTQRHQYKLFYQKRQDGKRSSRSSMTEERIALLEAEGFSWEVRAVRGPKMSWDERYAELKAFYEREGHCRVPADNPQLNRWCNDQRTRLKQMQKDGTGTDPKMGPERVEALAALGFTAVST